MGIDERIKYVIAQSQLTIDEFAERVGEKSQRVKDVLRGKQKAPQEMLASIVLELGVDARWLLTGLPENTGLTHEESMLIGRYRLADKAGRDAILGAAIGQSIPRTVINQHGDAGQVAHVAGNLDQSGLTITLGRGRRGKLA